MYQPCITTHGDLTFTNLRSRLDTQYVSLQGVLNLMMGHVTQRSRLPRSAFPCSAPTSAPPQSMCILKKLPSSIPPAKGQGAIAGPAPGSGGTEAGIREVNAAYSTCTPQADLSSCRGRDAYAGEGFWKIERRIGSRERI